MKESWRKTQRRSEIKRGGEKGRRIRRFERKTEWGGRGRMEGGKREDEGENKERGGDSRQSERVGGKKPVERK